MARSLQRWQLVSRLNGRCGLRPAPRQQGAAVDCFWVVDDPGCAGWPARRGGRRSGHQCGGRARLGLGNGRCHGSQQRTRRDIAGRCGVFGLRHCHGSSRCRQADLGPIDGFLPALGQRLTFVFRQRLIGLPPCLFFFFGNLLRFLKGQPCPAALSRTQARPFDHPILYALSLLGGQGRKARGHVQPLGLARGTDRAPVRLKWTEYLLLLWSEAGPVGATLVQWSGGTGRRCLTTARRGGRTAGCCEEQTGDCRDDAGAKGAMDTVRCQRPCPQSGVDGIPQILSKSRVAVGVRR